MALYNFHRVLIAAAILFGFGFALYSFRTYSHDGQAVNLGMAVVSTLLAGGMAAYLIYFNSRISVLRHLAGDDSFCRRCHFDLRQAITAGKTACPECDAPIPAALLRS